MVDKKTNHSRGFGFITLEDFMKAESVLKSQPHIIKGKRIECKLAIPKDSIDEQQQNEEQIKKKPIKDLSFYSRKLFVGGLPLLMKENDMLKYFQRFGEVEKCIIKKDEITGKCRGFGFVIFVNKESIDVVLSYGNSHFVLGKWIECKKATPKEKRYASLVTSLPNNSYLNENNNQFSQDSINIVNYQNTNYNLNESMSSNQAYSHLNQTINSNNITNENEQYYFYETDSNNNPNDNVNTFAASPNNCNNPVYSNQSNLFQYQNYIPKKQKAFFNKFYENSFPGIGNNKTIPTNNLESNSTGKKINTPIEKKQLNSHISESVKEKQDNMIKPNNQSNNMAQYNINKINTSFIPKEIIDHNNNHLHKYNPNIPNENGTFSNFFNNCIQNPYFNSYFHYKLFDSNGEEVSKLVYKNSDKVTLFVDNKRGNNNNLINNNGIIESKPQVGLELIPQEKVDPYNQLSRNITISDSTYKNANKIVLIQPDKRDKEKEDENQQQDYETRQETDTIGFHSEKDKSPDNSSNFYKPY